MEYAVETFSLTKIFSDFWGRARVCAVDELNLQIKYNEVFGLLGPNGSGKTTTLKMMLGLLHPTKGKAFLLGGDSANPKIAERIGFMPEESYLYRYLTARETLDFYGRLFALPATVRKERIEMLLDMVGLKAVANRQVGTYSKGMARRIGLAQALINDPELLILDEPTTGLDPIGTRQIKDLIIQLAKRGKTILLCSHLLADVEDVCDRISILYGGKVQTEGKVRELLQQKDKMQINTGAISDNAVERIRQIVQDEDADFEVTFPMDKLESYFIRIVEAAQRRAMTTSGAVSTTQIGQFLASAASDDQRRHNILDKLLTASVSNEQEPPAVTTEPVVAVEDTQDKPDKNLINKLISTGSTSESEPDVKTEPVETKVPPPVQVDKDLLDELAGRLKSDDQNNKEDKPHTGDKGDA
ncbi:MAG: ABC transporter ATP-binding protein [Planctomycetota bacterium]|jgi:ABC-2 type transport system ATP-binding protein